MMHKPRLAGAAPGTEGRVIRWAAGYDRWTTILTLGKAPTIRRNTAELAQIKPGDVVLDVGCGTGELTLQAKVRAGSAGKVYGIDPAPEMIAVARQKVAHGHTEVDFQVGVIEDLPFALLSGKRLPKVSRAS
jgi:ubiquinone/menaquinone biosynthesis C-methylase UbiE